MVLKWYFFTTGNWHLTAYLQLGILQIGDNGKSLLSLFAIITEQTFFMIQEVSRLIQHFRNANKSLNSFSIHLRLSLAGT